MTLFATEKLPQPVALDGVVINDLPSRSLSVRLPEAASGYEKLWWKQAWLQLRAAVEDGWRKHPYVWASTPGAYQVAHVEPGDFQTLVVSFPSGLAAYSELIIRPGVVAIATVDRNSNRFLGVKFLTARELVAGRQEALIEALDAAVPAYRPLYRPCPTSLVPSSKPIRGDAREVASYLSTGGETTSEPPVAAERQSLSPVEAEDDAVWRAHRHCCVAAALVVVAVGRFHRGARRSPSR